VKTEGREGSRVTTRKIFITNTVGEKEIGGGGTHAGKTLCVQRSLRRPVGEGGGREISREATGKVERHTRAEWGVSGDPKSEVQSVPTSQQVS